jgi:hypothetical protein
MKDVVENYNVNHDFQITLFEDFFVIIIFNKPDDTFMQDPEQSM